MKSNAAVETLAIHTATSQQEVEAIQKLRYRVYTKEMGLDLPGVDHGHELLSDPLDRGASHLFARIGDEVAGAVRLNLNLVPPELETHLLAHSLPRPFVYCSRLFVLADWRGTGVVQNLIEASFENFYKCNAAIAVCHCYPHLFKLYARLGFRQYGTPFVTPGLEHLGAQTPLQCSLDRNQLSRAA